MNIAFHGGEPCLIGAEQFNSWCTESRRSLSGVAEVEFSIQTNGTVLDSDWIDVFRLHHVTVGVSMDGPQEIHDVFRVDHQGRGSYEAVERGLRLLEREGIPFGVFTVIPLGEDPLRVHRHFVGLGCDYISYLLPDYTHDTIAPVRKKFGSSPCADFLIPVFDDWCLTGALDVRIRDFWNIGRIILGGMSSFETFGNLPAPYVVVEADGSIEGPDVLRVCENGLASTGLNVYENDFCEVADSNSLHRAIIFEGMKLPHGCQLCIERETCGGGYLPHRYSLAQGFDNPSVWCVDILKLFRHIRDRLGVSPEETQARRAALQNRAKNNAPPKTFLGFWDTK